MKSDQEQSGRSERKWLAVTAVLVAIWILIWVLYFAGVIKPIH